ncbi:hypothetical protein [Streptomyces sp. L2]|uniref:hypothetical protein n=1 Tax=Streptomyces sp. L2 TaxID=2162665 RepID=UPI0010125B66|nr:hypothetical protein [Streptomyces sp. L2]
MIAADVRQDAASVVRALTDAVPDVVIATWGGTARAEMTARSDLDLMCWNPSGAPLPEVDLGGGRYLDLVTCSGDASRLRSWARTNATDLHAVMFSRPVGGDPALLPAFQEAVGTLWRDATLRAREVVHLLATATALPRVHGPHLQRPEKFGLGGTRGWTALGECEALVDGRLRHRTTTAALTALAAGGEADPCAPDAFAAAMLLRRRCESGGATYDDHRAVYALLSSLYLSSARRLLTDRLPWLREHAATEVATLRRLSDGLLGDSGLGGTEPPDTTDPWAAGEGCSETETMLRVFTARSHRDVAVLLASPHGGSWWVRHAALMNPWTDAEALRRIIRHTERSGDWWGDRNLVLYAIRHPNSSFDLLDDIVRICPGLRLMDLEAVRVRRATLDFSDHTPKLRDK